MTDTYFGAYHKVTINRDFVLKEQLDTRPGDLIAREIAILNLLQTTTHPTRFPRVLETGDTWFKMENKGIPIELRISFRSQLDEISQCLDEVNVVHGAISRFNMVEKDGYLSLIDFDHAYVRGSSTLRRFFVPKTEREQLTQVFSRATI